MSLLHWCSFLLGWQVRFLEQQKRVLATKKRVLLEQGSSSNTNNHSLETFFENYISSLKDFPNGLHIEKNKLQEELRNTEEMVEDFKKKYMPPGPWRWGWGLQGGLGSSLALYQLAASLKFKHSSFPTIASLTFNITVFNTVVHGLFGAEIILGI